jgi:single-stranded DNA-specific DHH superfamily exonuclease
MLNKKQINEIKKHLNKAQNPLFFFDNDADGLCSFILLQKYIGAGKGVPIKSFPSLTKEYTRKIRELNPDYIFILDKPEVSLEFFEEVHKINLPIIWIDHHITDVEIPDYVNYYNPSLTEKINAPVTALCYQITKQNLWIAITGCISDKFSPEFYIDFQKKYPDLSTVSNKANDILYQSGIGKISRLLNAGLKDKTTNVINMIKFLINAKNPYEVIDENQKNHTMHQRYDFINGKQKKLIKKAKEKYNKKSKILFFEYSGDMSISADLSNELNYLFPDKIIVVAYLTGSKANISVRGENIKNKTLKIIKGLKESTGGGHENAVGAMINKEDLREFEERMNKEFTTPSN